MRKKSVKSKSKKLTVRRPKRVKVTQKMFLEMLIENTRRHVKGRGGKTDSGMQAQLVRLEAELEELKFDQSFDRAIETAMQAKPNEIKVSYSKGEKK